MITTANSYASIEQADLFHDERANEAWLTASDEAKSASLIRATDYIDSAYVFKSVRALDDQPLECPRFGEETLNHRLVKATMLLALDMLANPLVVSEESEIVSESKSLEGVGSKSTTYRAKGSDPYPFITKMLAPIAARRSASVGIITMVRP